MYPSRREEWRQFCFSRQPAQRRPALPVAQLCMNCSCGSLACRRAPGARLAQSWPRACRGAGLAAYASWQPTLRRLAAPGAPPAAFTDFCEEAALRAAAAVAAALGAGGVAPAGAPRGLPAAQGAAGAAGGRAAAAAAPSCALPMAGPCLPCEAAAAGGVGASPRRAPAAEAAAAPGTPHVDAASQGDRAAPACCSSAAGARQPGAGHGWRGPRGPGSSGARASPRDGAGGRAGAGQHPDARQQTGFADPRGAGLHPGAPEPAAAPGCSQPGEAAHAGRAPRVGAVAANPFRQPRSCQGADNALPSYSNGFLFYVG